MSENFIGSQMEWINEPKNHSISNSGIMIETSADTDFWQGTYYGLEYDNAPALLKNATDKKWSFSVKVDFEPASFFDQCGVVIYQNSMNWLKAGLEFQNNGYQQLFSVVTNDGYSDWSMYNYDKTSKSMYYRLSKREKDFLLEYSLNGIEYEWMRMFHIEACETFTRVGVFASSPGESSFQAHFSELKWDTCKWKGHESNRF